MRTAELSAFPALRFQVLGPIRAWHDGTELDLGSPQQRAVLAVLLLSQGWQVPMKTLISAIWGDDPPRAAPGTIRTYISRLRRQLDLATDYQADELITSIGDGYAIQPGLVTVDADLFAKQVQDAQLALGRGETSSAASLLKEARGLWRGVPLAGLRGPYADSQRTRLAELRMAATEEQLAAEIGSGFHLAAIAELRPRPRMIWRSRPTPSQLSWAFPSTRLSPCWSHWPTCTSSALVLSAATATIRW